MSNTVNVIHIKASPEEAAENLLDTLKGELQRKGDILCTAWTELHTLLSQPGVVTVEDPAILSTLQDKGTLLSTTWNELYNLIAAYQTELSSRESQVVTAWGQIQNKEQLVGELRKRVANLEEELRKKNVSMSTTQATITQLLSQQKKYDGATDDKQAQIDKFQADLEDRETVLSNLTLENLALTAKVEELESHVQNLDPTRSEREETLEKYRSEILRLTEENGTLAEKFKMARKVSEPVTVKAVVPQAANGVKEVKLVPTPVQTDKQPEKKPTVQVVTTFPLKFEVAETCESKGGQCDATVTNITVDQTNSSAKVTETPPRKTRSAGNASPTNAPTKEAATPSATDIAVASITTPRASGRRRKAEDTPKPNENTPASASQTETSPIRSKRGRIIKAKGGNQTWTDYYAGSGYLTDVKSEPIQTYEAAQISSKDVKASPEVAEMSSDYNHGCNVTDAGNVTNTAPSRHKITARNDTFVCNLDSLDKESVVTIVGSREDVQDDLTAKSGRKCDVVKLGNNCSKCECKFTTGRSLRMHMLLVHPVEGEFKNYLGTESAAGSEGRAERSIVESSLGKNTAEYAESSPEKSFSESSPSKNMEENRESRPSKDLAKKSQSESSPCKTKNVVRSPKKSANEYVCEECSETFPRKCLLKRHVKDVHYVEKPHRCGYCGKRYAFKEQLKTHHVMHNAESPHRCDQCDARFPKKSQLVRHTRSHTGERPFVCDNDKCNKSFTDAYLLTLHKRRHGKLNPFICETCGATFRNNSDIKRHMMSHTDERRHHCFSCGKDFRRLEHLRLHLRIHTGEKPYKCEQCLRGFAQSGDLKKHEKTHTGEQAFKCDCGKAFAHKAAYQRHFESHKRDLVKREAESVKVIRAPPGNVTPLTMQVEEESQESNKVENLVIDESLIQNISVNPDTNTHNLDLQHVQSILSMLAQGDLRIQPLTIIQTDQGSGSQVALRVVDNNIHVVPLSEITSEEAASSNIVQLEAGTRFPQTNVQGVEYDNLLLQLQDAVATASNTAGDQVVHVFVEQGDQVEQEVSQIE